MRVFNPGWKLSLHSWAENSAPVSSHLFVQPFCDFMRKFQSGLEFQLDGLGFKARLKVMKVVM